MKLSLDPRKILETPGVYNAFQRLTRTREYRRRFMEGVPLPAGARVLEVGCGPGTNFQFLPERKDVRYVGCDLDAQYIAHAKSRYGDRAEFFAAPVGALQTLGPKRFDTVIAWGLLHHLKDHEVRTLADEVAGLLEPGGSFCTFDPCFTYEQPLVERLLTACDRGRFVRYPEQYVALLDRRFSEVREEVWPPGTILRFSVAVLNAVKAAAQAADADARTNALFAG